MRDEKVYATDIEEERWGGKIEKKIYKNQETELFLWKIQDSRRLYAFKYQVNIIVWSHVNGMGLLRASSYTPDSSSSWLADWM